MNYSLLKKSRVIVSIALFLLCFIVFVDPYEFVSEQTGSSILYFQFIPSILKFVAVSSLISTGFIFISILSFSFGRVYCSSFCPLGTLQDFFSWIHKKTSNRKRLFKYSKAFKILRYTILIISVLSLLLGTSLIISLLDPYSNVGRILTYIVKPVVIFINNLIASLLNSNQIYSLHIIEITSAPWLIILFTLLFFVIIAYMSFKRGRLFCNSVCPVGTLLGIVSSNSLYKIKFDKDACTSCGKCSSICKSECINLKTKEVDHSRCVTCFNCLPVCNDSALKLTHLKLERKVSSQNVSNSPNINRRKVIKSLLILTASSSVLTTYAQNGKHHRGGKKHELRLVKSKFAISPPGSKSIERLNSLCTACGLCISACPTNVLQPSFTDYGIRGFMQPYMDYANAGFCNFDCNRCGEVCPTGAILPLSLPDKQLTQLGKAVFVKRNCVVHTDGTDCGACSEHCPTKAVDMIPYRDGLVIPQVNQDICIGCGACEHPCPVDFPHKAIYVESNIVHVRADKPKEVKSEYVDQEEDFPF